MTPPAWYEEIALSLMISPFNWKLRWVNDWPNHRGIYVGPFYVSVNWPGP